MTHSHPNPDPLTITPPDPDEDLAGLRKSAWYLGYVYGRDGDPAPLRRGIGWAIAIVVVLAFAIFALSSPAAATSEAPHLRAAPYAVEKSGGSSVIPGGASPQPAPVNVTGSVGTVPATPMPALSAVYAQTGPVTHSTVIAATLSGTATWYCGAGSVCTAGYGPLDMVAAIDPTTGIDKGERVRVTHAGKSITVTVVDVCLCKGDRVIDLTSGAFLRLANTSLGVIPVELVSLGRVKLPDTSTEEP